MVCPSCNQSVQADWKLCPFCGNKLAQKPTCTECQAELQPQWQVCPFCGAAAGAPAGGRKSTTAPEILGYCAGNGSAIRASDPHFKCLSCGQLYTEKFRFLDHPVCETCAYKDGTAQQLEKELSAQREAEARAKEEQLRKERAEQERREAEERAAREKRQKEEAELKAREAAEAAQKPHICPVTGMEFVPVPEGEFQMGDVWGDGESNAKPTRMVTVPGFQMAKYPVTQAQWLKVMGGKNPVMGNRFVHPDKPVVGISWNDAHNFIKRLNRKSGCNYRLPSEAEWEYAARSGGSKEKYSGTNYESSLSAYAHFSQSEKKGSTNIVGQMRPNDLGLYDMSGNVLEWCEDCWHCGYEGAPSDSSAWTSGGDPSRPKHILRGGAWDTSSSGCRIDCRISWYSSYRFSSSYGFRLAL